MRNFSTQKNRRQGSGNGSAGRGAAVGKRVSGSQSSRQKSSAFPKAGNGSSSSRFAPKSSDRVASDRRQAAGKPYPKFRNDRRKDTRFAAKEVRAEQKFTLKSEEEGVRINKFIANSGVCSRREADEFVKAGLVTVNGQVVTEMGAKVMPGDDVRFNGERLKGESKVYILMNKPKDVVTTVYDPHADRTVMDLIGSKCTQRVFPVGRLDKSTTGVLLLTNDGELAEKLTHPSYEKKKIYHVFLDKNLKGADYDKLLSGFNLFDGPVKADSLSYVDGEKNQLGVEIHSGRNRIVRRMFEHLGYKVKKLDRVYFAGLTKYKLRRGEWRYLTQQEIQMLRTGFYE